ncbi:hypothetical protein E2C01_087856 [Portunus trituberculatus]|uniref:Uncharacterized protein n=1 Tax=Portunus trituberculatus TaxID=210409 RepID=A0A5B7J7R3_PORTR|nr:hypothetical protein [Portunus trituberculatus]
MMWLLTTSLPFRPRVTSRKRDKDGAASLFANFDDHYHHQYSNLFFVALLHLYSSFLLIHGGRVLHYVPQGRGKTGVNPQVKHKRLLVYNTRTQLVEEIIL